MAFVDESANHLIYSKEVLFGKRVDTKDKKKDSGSSFATRVETPATPVIPKEMRSPETKKFQRCPCCNKEHQLDDCD